jgi:hypothetical protein
VALEKLRKDMKAAAPKAEECISYGIPGFRLDGKLLVSYGALQTGCLHAIPRPILHRKRLTMRKWFDSILAWSGSDLHWTRQLTSSLHAQANQRGSDFGISSSHCIS